VALTLLIVENGLTIAGQLPLVFDYYIARKARTKKVREKGNANQNHSSA